MNNLVSFSMIRFVDDGKNKHVSTKQKKTKKPTTNPSEYMCLVRATMNKSGKEKISTVVCIYTRRFTLDNILIRNLKSSNLFDVCFRSMRKTWLNFRSLIVNFSSQTLMDWKKTKKLRKRKPKGNLSYHVIISDLILSPIFHEFWFLFSFS